MEVDVPALFAPQGRGGDILILNGDIVWVERQPMVYIYGEVQRPGTMRLERGITQRGTERGIRVHRRGADGKTQVLQPAMDDQLQDRDVVFVRESLF